MKTDPWPTTLRIILGLRWRGAAISLYPLREALSTQGLSQQYPWRASKYFGWSWALRLSQYCVTRRQQRRGQWRPIELWRAATAYHTKSIPAAVGLSSTGIWRPTTCATWQGAGIWPSCPKERNDEQAQINHTDQRKGHQTCALPYFIHNPCFIRSRLT